MTHARAYAHVSLGESFGALATFHTPRLRAARTFTIALRIQDRATHSLVSRVGNEVYNVLAGASFGC